MMPPAVWKRSDTLRSAKKRRISEIGGGDEDGPNKRQVLGHVERDSATITTTLGGEPIRHLMTFIPDIPDPAFFDSRADAALEDAKRPGALIELPQAVADSYQSPRRLWTNSDGGDLIQAFMDHTKAERERAGVVTRVHEFLNAIRPGSTLDTLQDKTYVHDLLAEMAVRWMDVRWRTMSSYWTRESLEFPLMELPAKGTGPATSQRQLRNTQEYINSFIHGGNLRHDTFISSIGYATSRLDDNLTRDYYQALQKKQFEQTYKIKLRQAEWLVRQPAPEDPNSPKAIDWPRVVNIIDRYISCYEVEMSFQSGNRKTVRNRVNPNPRSGHLDYTRFMATVGEICDRGLTGSNPAATKALCNQLKADAKALIQTCVRWPSWTEFEDKPKWAGTQADNLQEKLRTL
ncbi:hypothetical protein MAPG_07886 [Magnaporthiopsis poae ATCC 64411]|uniref:Uncharacterized protein n=1 Tax=Magnaporthiopsis poae (strain ATCC 64411 / 73-15) TaxID=644358 RepID=A0A0C4E5V9_MAGP6|nr:hypothetical protein MAPG_07886 [Magnaporthiopsis poae ATCC 64411]